MDTSNITTHATNAYNIANNAHLYKQTHVLNVYLTMLC